MSSRVGGDSAVRFERDAQILDAHSRNSGDFDRARSIGDSSVFLTPEGAAAFDQFVEQGFEPELMSDSTLKRQLLGRLLWRAELEDNPALEGREQRFSGRR